jgi:hypothetical protein
MKGIFSSARGDNSKNVKHTLNFFKKYSPESTSQILSNLVQLILG